jgi:two-component system OmpR family response regulator
VLERGNLTLDLDRMSVLWRGVALQLTVTEYWIVHALVRFPGHVKTRDQLMQEANVVVDDSTITSHIKRVRKKFQAIDKEFDCIDTVYAMGYRWTCSQSPPAGMSRPG